MPWQKLQAGSSHLLQAFFFRPTLDGSRQVVYQAGKTIIAFCKFTELMQWQHQSWWHNVHTKENWIGSIHNPLSCHRAKQKSKQQKPKTKVTFVASQVVSRQRTTLSTMTRLVDHASLRFWLASKVSALQVSKSRRLSWLIFSVQRLRGFRQVVTQAFTCRKLNWHAWKATKESWCGPLHSP